MTFFLLLVFCSGSFFVFKQYYGPLTKYLVENVHMDLTGVACFSVFVGYKNLVLGFLHGLAD